MTTIQEIAKFAKVTEGLFNAALAHLGNPATFTEVAWIEADDWVRLRNAALNPPEEEGGDPRPLTAAQRGHLRRFERVVGLKAGTVTRGDLAPKVAAASTTPPTPAAGGGMKVKLSSLVDSSAEADLVSLDGAAIRKMFSEHYEAMGDYPHKDLSPRRNRFRRCLNYSRWGPLPTWTFRSSAPTVGGPSRRSP